MPKLSTSSWELLETVPDESLTCAALRSTCKDPSLAEECEALDVFDEGVECAEAEGGGDAVPATDNGNSEPSVGGKMNYWMRKLSQHAKLQKLNMQRASQRHSSAPDSVKETPSTASAHHHFNLNFSRSSPLMVVPSAEGETRTSPVDRRADDTAGNSKFKKLVHGMMRSRDQGDADDSSPPPPQRMPQTAPPNLSRQHDEHTLMNRVNKKLINYLKVVRTAVSDSAGDGNKGRRGMQLVKVIDLTSESEVSVTKMTYAEYLTLGTWFYCFAFYFLFVFALVFFSSFIFLLFNFTFSL